MRRFLLPREVLSLSPLLCCTIFSGRNRAAAGSSTPVSVPVSEFGTTMVSEMCTPATDWSGRYTAVRDARADVAPVSTISDDDVTAIVDGLQRKQRRAISRAVTLIESTNPAHAAVVSRILREVARRNADASSQPHAHTGQRRIAISGPPGAGKSCFIEALGCHLVDKGLTVGVLAVDPSSTVTGGSILGDKVRMERLSLHDNAYVRPSPSKGHLGGVTARCWETLELFEAARFDVTLVETVGVGQSETEATHMTDLFVLLVPPASGDEMQGVKKGIVELADVVIVTKADGPREDLAEAARRHYERAVRLSMSDRRGNQMECTAEAKPVMTVSSEKGTRIAEAWNVIDSLWLQHAASGELRLRREEQLLEHFRLYLHHQVVELSWKRLREAKHRTTGVTLESALLDSVLKGHMTPREAGDVAIGHLFGNRS